MMFCRFLRSTLGTTAVEFAMTAPVFFALLFGMIDGGRLIWTQVGLQYAVEMGARCASLQTEENPSACPGGNVEQFAANQAVGLNLPASVFKVSTGVCGGTQVAANYNFTFVAGYFGGPSLALSAQSCFPN